MLVCSPKHPLASEQAIKPRSLKGQDFVHFAPDAPSRQVVDRMLNEHGAEVQSVATFDSVEAVKRAVEIELGVAILPEAVVKQEVGAGRLAAVPLAVKCAWPLGLVYRRNKVLSEAMERFVELLVFMILPRSLEPS